MFWFMEQLFRPKKIEQLSSMMLGYLTYKSDNQGSWKKLRVLLDSGCGATQIHYSFINVNKCTSTKK